MNIYAFRSCYTGVVAGGDTHLQGFLKWVSDNSDHEVTIIQPRDKAHTSANPIPNGVRLKTYHFPRRYTPYAVIFILRALVASAVVRLHTAPETNVLIASSHFLPDVLPIVYQKILHPHDKTIVFIYHLVQDSERPNSFSNFLANLQEKLCLLLIRRFFDGVIVDNKRIKERLLAKGFKMPILASSNFVNSSLIQPSSNKKYTISFCGRFVKQKGIYDFLKVIEGIQHRFPKSEAIMIGDGPERVKLTKLVSDKKLPIKFSGYVSDAIKYQLISQSKLFVFPSYEEGWGIVIAEALAAGVQVLAYDLPVYREVFLDKVQTVKKGDVSLLTLQAETLLAISYNSVALSEFAKRFDVNSVSKRELDFITGIRGTPGNEKS